MLLIENLRKNALLTRLIYFHDKYVMGRLKNAPFLVPLWRFSTIYSNQPGVFQLSPCRSTANMEFVFVDTSFSAD